MCLGRHTVTGLLTTLGLEFHDWSAEYRLFSRQRLPVASIFGVIRRSVLAELPRSAPLSVAIDDSLLRKTGTRIAGVAWRRDPLGPPFQTNFVRAQRFLQFSAAVPLADHRCRMVPISFHHAPTPVRPRPKASEKERARYRQAARKARISALAAEQIVSLRRQMDEDDEPQRALRLFVDGGYTNRTVLKQLPDRTTLVGRIRKDAKLNFPPDAAHACGRRGRPQRYGAAAPTPEQLLKDESVPWINLEAFISGVARSLRVKLLQPVLWRAAGLNHTLQLVVIAPLGYRLRNNSKLLYRKPAFLICTDAQLDLRTLVQGYIERWDIEVNFREEKTLLGVGEAQVREAGSVEAVPALAVASYAMLLLAAIRTAREGGTADLLPAPKWSTESAAPRISTQRAINHLRAEVWGRGLGVSNFSDFATHSTLSTKPQKFAPDLSSAVLYAAN